MNVTPIEWTATYHQDGTVTPGCTWNPIRARWKDGSGPRSGHYCEKVSPGCANCYASGMQRRFGMPPFPGRGTMKLGETVAGAIGVFLDEKKLLEPLKRRKPAKVFVCDMSDLFGEWVPDEFIDRVFAVMALCPQHTFQVLTKRAERMARWFGRFDRMTRPEIESDLSFALRSVELPPGALSARAWAGFTWPFPNVWLGVSVEDQQRKERVRKLLDCPAAVRFVSAEPLLEEVRLDKIENGTFTPFNALRRWTDGKSETGIDWVIVGGESGPRARPCNVEWVRSIVRQCKAAGVACFVKQWGSNPIDCKTPNGRTDGHRGYVRGPALDCAFCKSIKLKDSKGGDPSEWPEDLRVRQFPRRCTKCAEAKK